MALTKVTSDGITDGTIIGTDLATNVDLIDNKKIRFGTGNDLSIYHDGTSSFLSNTTGDLKIDSDSIKIRQSNGNAFIKCQNTATELYFADNKKLETTSSGATITGSLGIGTTSPSTNLHVHTSSNDSGITVKSTGNTSNAFNFDANRSGANAGIGGVKGRWNGTTVAQISFNTGSDTSDKNDGYVMFGTESAASNGNVNATERMRIDSSGNVMIGTTSASGKLHVEHSGELNSYFVGNTSTSGSRIILWNKNTTANSFTGVLGADAGGQTTASINFYSADNDTNEGYLNLETRPASGLPTERMRIDSSGRVGIGTTSPLKKLHIADAGDVGLMLQTTNAVNDKEIFEISVGGNASNHADLIFRTRVNAGTGGSEVMRLTNVGNVGIGTSTIADDADHCKLAISGQSGTASGVLIFQDTSNNEDGMIFADDGNLFIVADRDNATSSSSIRFRVDGSSEKMRIDSSGRVGIGTSSPDDRLVLSGSTGDGVKLIDGTHIVVFRTVSGGGILKTASNHSLIFGTNDTERMRLDSSGRVGIGTTSGAVGGAPSSQTGQFNVLSSAASGQWAMQARADNAAGNGLFLRAGANSSYYTAYLTGYDENNVHMVVRGDGNIGIGTSSPDQILHLNKTSGDAYLRIQGGTNQGTLIHKTDGTLVGGFASGGSVGGGANDIAMRVESGNNMLFAHGTTEDMRIQSGGGISFNGDTAAANALDDYEEGTWTPSVIAGNPLPTISNIVSASYTKIGRLVTVSAYFNMNSTSSNTDNLVIGGLPFTAVGGTKYSYGTGRIGTIATPAFQVNTGATNINAFANSGNAANWNNAIGSYILFSVTYEAA